MTTSDERFASDPYGMPIDAALKHLLALAPKTATGQKLANWYDEQPKSWAADWLYIGPLKVHCPIEEYAVTNIWEDWDRRVSLMVQSATALPYEQIRVECVDSQPYGLAKSENFAARAAHLSAQDIPKLKIAVNGPDGAKGETPTWRAWIEGGGLEQHIVVHEPKTWTEQGAIEERAEWIAQVAAQAAPHILSLQLELEKSIRATRSVEPSWRKASLGPWLRNDLER